MKPIFTDGVKGLIIDALRTGDGANRAHELIDAYNENHPDTQICPVCGHDLHWVDGYRCGGMVCDECDYEDIENTYY